MRGESNAAPVKTREIKSREFFRIKNCMVRVMGFLGCMVGEKGRRGDSFSEIRTWKLKFNWSYIMPVVPLRGKLEGLDVQVEKQHSCESGWHMDEGWGYPTNQPQKAGRAITTVMVPSRDKGA